MRLQLITCVLPTLLVLGMGEPAQAQSVIGTAKISPKTLAQASAPAQTQPSSSTNRPFVLEPENELPGVSFNGRAVREKIAGSCAASSASICYDYRTGRAVYRPAREWMPEINGLKRESLSVKRDKVVLHYSF